jgi:hypothetical protein
MTPFGGLLQTRKLGPRRWELAAPFTYGHPLLPMGAVTVPAGFVTDYASVPRWLPLTWMLVGDTAHEAAVVHDYVYRTGIVSRAVADHLLHDAALEAGEPRWRAVLLYGGVRVGGWVAWRRYRRAGSATMGAVAPSSWA